MLSMYGEQTIELIIMPSMYGEQDIELIIMPSMYREQDIDYSRYRRGTGPKILN